MFALASFIHMFVLSLGGSELRRVGLEGPGMLSAELWLYSPAARFEDDLARRGVCRRVSVGDVNSRYDNLWYFICVFICANSLNARNAFCCNA